MRANQCRPPGRRWNYPKPFVKTFISNGPVQASAADPCVQAAVHILEQGSGLLNNLPDEAYCRRLAAASGASIGGHYRHCLDHFVCLLEGMASGALDYDKRRRDSQMEHCRMAALEATEEIRESLTILDVSILERPITVQCKIHYVADRSQQAKSTAARELMYVVAHAVHHFALIAVMAKVMDFPLPDNFGVAPSTLQHRSQAASGVLA